MARRLLLLAALALAPALALAQGLPDLTITQLSVAPDMVTAGEAVSVRYTVCNLGPVGVILPVVGFFLSEDGAYEPGDRFLREHAAVPLDAGACSEEFLSLTIPLDVEPGNYTLFAVADYDEVLPELDETNNVRGTALTVEGVLVPPIDVVLNPLDPPITIPDGGGAFAFDLLVVSLSLTPVTFDVWAEVVRPNGSVYRDPRFGPVRLTLAPGETRGPVTLRPRVPATVPAGLYLFRVSAGTFPGAPIDAESFEVEVLGSAGRTTLADAGRLIDQTTHPLLAGLSGEGTETSAAPVVCPNPARGMATVSFDLAAAAEVRLQVHDPLGRSILTLPAQALEAGHHVFRLDVSGLPAGFYIYRLETGVRPAATGRLTLVE